MKNVSVKKMNEKGKNALRAVLIVVVLIFATCFALAACATGEEVQIEKVTSASEINRLIDKANFTAENAVRDKMEERYGVLSDYSYINGKATANVEKDGKSYAVSAEIDLGVSDFEVTKYTNAELSGNNLTYTSKGQDVSENVSDKIVVEENGVIYVIDPSEALNTISIAVSDAILTENVDPENPGDPTDPENPDPEEPENPTDPENPDPEEPENPGDEGGNIEIENGEYQNFDEFVLDLEGENLDAFKTAVSEALRNGFTTSNWLSLFGRGTTAENTKTYQFAFNQNSAGEIESVQYVAIKNDVTISKGTVTFTTPISIENLKKATYSGDVEEIVENGELVGIRYVENNEQKDVRPTENQILTKESDGTYSLIDYTDFVFSISRDNISTVVRDFLHTGSETLTETNQAYFDLCMPLAVEAGLIDANANLGFVAVQGRSSTNAEWGTTFNIVINFVDLSTNQYRSLAFIFDDEQDKDTLLECLQSAIERGNFSATIRSENTIISGDQIFEFPEALEDVAITNLFENQK